MGKIRSGQQLPTSCPAVHAAGVTWAIWKGSQEQGPALARQHSLTCVLCGLQVDGDAVDKLCKFLHKGFCRGLQALPSRSACASSGWRGSGPAAQKLLTPASTMKWLQQQQQHRSTSRQQLRHSTPARSDPGVQPAATIFGGARRRCQQQRQQCACVLGTQWLCIQLAAADS